MAVILEFETRRRNDTPQTRPVRAYFARNRKVCKNKDLLAEAPGFEPGDVVGHYAFEMSREFLAHWPTQGTRDLSRRSCEHPTYTSLGPQNGTVWWDKGFEVGFWPIVLVTNERREHLPRAVGAVERVPTLAACPATARSPSPT